MARKQRPSLATWLPIGSENLPHRPPLSFFFRGAVEDIRTLHAIEWRVTDADADMGETAVDPTVTE